MVDQSLPDSLTLATFNVHMGVDGWGRPFDVAGACRSLGADLVVMQESWTPDRGGPSTAQRVADEAGYRVVAEVSLAHGRLFAPLPTSTRRWGPWLSQIRKTFRLDDERSQTGAGAGGPTVRARQLGARPPVTIAGPRRRDHPPGSARPGSGPAGGDPRTDRAARRSVGGVRHPYVPHHPRIPRPVPAAEPAAAGGRHRGAAGRRHEPLGTSDHVVLPRMATGRAGGAAGRPTGPTASSTTCWSPIGSPCDRPGSPTTSVPTTVLLWSR